MVENIELTMSHVGLGELSEYALMTLFGNAHSHRLVKDLDINPSQMADSQGAPLYPAYFRTHLTVPAHCMLSSFKLWDIVDVGVDVSRYGKMILSSDYIIGKKGSIGENPEEWDETSWPTMRGNNLITVDIAGNLSAKRKVSVPDNNLIAPLKALKTVPVYVRKSNEMKETGFGIRGNPLLSPEDAFVFYVESHQDAAPGHAMMFAQFVRIMDWAEKRLLTRRIAPGFPVDLINHLNVLEREIYYYSNCFCDTELLIYIKGDIKSCQNDYHGSPASFISVFTAEFEFEIYERSRNNLLCIGYVKKLFCMPTAQQDYLPVIKKILKSVVRMEELS